MRPSRAETGGEPTETTLARLKLGDGCRKRILREFRPIGIDEEELGVGALPKQETANALHTARADEKVRLGQAGGVEMGGEHVVGDRGRVDLAALGLGGQLTRGAYDLVARAVIEGCGELEAGIVLG